MKKVQTLTNPVIADAAALHEFANALVDRTHDIERKLAQLSEDPENRVIIADIFRELHNIKGDAGLCRVPLAGFIVHPLESIFVRLRSGELKYSKSLAEVILLSLDRLGLAIEALVAGKPVSQLSLVVLVEYLEKLSLAGRNNIESIADQLIKTVSESLPQATLKTSSNTPEVRSEDNRNQNMNMTNLNLSAEEIDHVFNNIDIPTCPAIVSMAMTEAQRDEPDLRKLVVAIEKDVGMSALTIKLANSPLFRTNQPVSRVSVALARLGIRNVVCIIIAAALRNCMSGVDAKWLEKFWSHTSLVATAAGMVARKQYGIAPDAAYTFALFHNSAIPLLRKRFDNYIEVMNMAMRDNIQLIDVEEKFFPCTHSIAGALLVRNWGLPAIIAQSIRFHHEKDVYQLPETSLPGSAVSLIAVTHVAERLLANPNENINFEVSDIHYQHALAHLGISEEELQEIRELLADQESFV